VVDRTALGLGEFRCGARKKRLIEQGYPSSLAAQELRLLLYQAALPLSSRTLNYTARLIRAHRRAIGTRWRVLDPGAQALLTLAYLHQGHSFEQLAPGFAISRATAARRIHEMIDLLSACAPRLRAGLRKARRSGRGYVILDGTLIRTDRLAADRPYYQGKHHCHGMNLQAVADPDGELLWVSGAIRGSIHDTAAARIWQLPRLLREYGLFALADKGYQGLDHDLVVTPYKGRGKPEYQKEHNRLHARLRGPGERVFAELKKWRVLRKLRCDPYRATQIARAVAALNHQERQSG
jgi:hypothetical protein